MADQRFLPQHRIRRNDDFQRVFKRRRSVSDAVLIVYACRNGLAYPRLGLSVSRKVGGAVRRNRWKRVLREAFRLSRPDLPTGVDLVIIPRATAEPELAPVTQSLVRLAHRVDGRLKRDA